MSQFRAPAHGLITHSINTYRLLNTPRPYSAYNIPITKPDPGPDGVLNTADDPGSSITYYAYPAALAGSAFAQTMLINDPNADQTFKSFEIAAAKRLSNHWQFNASYSATKKHIPFGNNPPLADNPNAEINIADNTWEWEAKIVGRVSLPGRHNRRRQLSEHQRDRIWPAGGVHDRRHLHCPVSYRDRGAHRHVSTAGSEPAGSSRRKGVPAPRAAEIHRAPEHLQRSQCQYNAECPTTVRRDVSAADVDSAASTLRARRDLFVLAPMECARGQGLDVRVVGGRRTNIVM